MEWETKCPNRIQVKIGSCIQLQKGLIIRFLDSHELSTHVIPKTTQLRYICFIRNCMIIKNKPIRRNSVFCLFFQEDKISLIWSYSETDSPIKYHRGNRGEHQ